MKPNFMFKIFAIRVFNLPRYTSESVSFLHPDCYVRVPPWYLKDWTIKVITHRPGFFSRS